MKIWQKGLWKRCCEGLVAGALVCALVWLAGCSRVPAQERCALCGNGERLRYHAPCLVNLATGEVGELAVYDPDSMQQGEIAETQRTGFMNFLMCAGVTALRDADTHTCRATLSAPEPLEPSHFCADCRAALETVGTEGWVLADLYAEEEMQLYTVTAGAEYTIRDYTVSITQDGKDERLDILVTGHVSS